MVAAATLFLLCSFVKGVKVVRVPGSGIFLIQTFAPMGGDLAGQVLGTAMGGGPLSPASLITRPMGGFLGGLAASQGADAAEALLKDLAKDCPKS